MKGIINWDELWKATHTGGFHHHGKDLVAHWDSRAKEFNKRVMKHRDKAHSQAADLGILPHETVLDVGAGTGRLAIPMARLAKSVTALDQSEGMLACLRENMAAEGIENITCIKKSWQDLSPKEIEHHDVVISSNSLGVYDLKEALTKMDSLAKRAVYIFTFTDHKRDDGFRDFLMRKEAGREKASWEPAGPAGYLVIYNLLADMGIYADIKIMEWQQDEHYASVDDAVAEWKKMHGVPEEKEKELQEFLSKKLVEDGTGYKLHRQHRQAMISWQKSRPLSA